MWPFILRHAVMPALSAVTPHKAWRYYKQYTRGDYDAPEARADRAWRKLKAMLAHAYEHVPFYRDKLDQAGIKPDDVRSWDDFRRIPVTTKHELRANFPDRVIADNYRSRRLRHSNTSGTTGRPLILVQDIDDINYKYAARLRGRALEGSFVGDRTLRTTPNECQPCLESGNVSDKGLLEYLKSQALHRGRKSAEYFVFIEKKLVNPFIHRRLMLPPIGSEPGDLDDWTLEFYCTEIERYKPKLWVTYPLYAVLLANYVKRTGRRAPEVGIIDLSGGVASSKMRELVSDAFAAPCFESYGGCEFGRYANECQARPGKMHVAEEHCYVEVLKPDGSPAADGELGNQIVTALTNYAMPTIRLEQGDTVIPHGHRCDCGRTSRLIDVRGRIQTLLVLPDGKTVTEKDVLDAVIDAPGVQLFQLVQQSANAYELRVAPTPGQQCPDADGLIQRLKRAISPDIEVEVKAVEHIGQEPSGKYMHVKSSSYNAFRCVPPDEIERDDYTRVHHH